MRLANVYSAICGMRSRSLLAPLLSLACACTPSGSVQPRTAHGSLAYGTPGAYDAELPHASLYSTEPTSGPLRGDAADARLAAALERSCKAAALTRDGRLADLAYAVARDSQGARQAPSYALVSFHARRAGLAEPTPQVWLASGPDTAALAPALEQAVRDAAKASRLTHCGAAAVHDPDGVVIALALSTRVFSLREPLPRQVEPGASIRFAGELARGFHSPTLAVTAPSGAVTRSPLGVDPEFAHDLRADQPGEYTIELLANGPEGLTVVAMFPVAVGVPIETRAPAGESEPPELDAAEVERKLSALIARERASRNLAPLHIDARLSRIALAHCEDMVEHGFIAHTSKLTGDATSRVRRAGLDAYIVLENIGRGYSASELHRGLMESPGHRGNILHPEARELGIGVVAEREGERLAFIATELFTQLARPARAP